MKDDETKYTYEEVISFCKTCHIEIVPRDKTFEFLEESGREFDDVINEIRQLKAVYACADIEPDYGRDKKGYVYQFKKLVFEKYWCYIKIKMKIGDKKIVVVLSFHQEDLDYVYRRTLV